MCSIIGTIGIFVGWILEMRLAAQLLVGKHDFKSFQAAGDEKTPCEMSNL